MKLNNNKGFTLILVLLVIAILSILGTTLIGMTVANYKMKLINTKAKQSFYLSEAGLEESYAKVYNLINDCLVIANSSVEDFLNNFSYEEEKQNESEGIDSPYINENGQIDEDYLEGKIDHVFKIAFEANIKGSIKDTIENTDEYYKEYDSIQVLESNPKFNNGKMEITIKSTYSVDEVKRKSQVELIITTPNYNGSYYAEYEGSDSEDIPYNEVWTKVLLSDDKIYFKTGKINITGDIKAKDIEIEKNVGNEINGDIVASSKLLIKKNGKIKIGEDIITKDIVIEESGKNEITGDIIAKDKIEIKEKGQNEIGGDIIGKDVQIKEKGKNEIRGDIIAKDIDIKGNKNIIYGERSEVSEKELENILKEKNVEEELIENLVDKNVKFKNADFNYDNNNEIIYITKNSDISLCGKNYNKKQINKDDIVIYLNKSETYSGIIISNKKIYLSGDINFNGIILAGEEINIYTKNHTNLNYDENYINGAIDEHNLNEYFNNTSGTSGSSGEQNINYGADLTFSNQNLEDIIELKNWNITY